MSGTLTASATVANTVVSAPRLSSANLGLDDIFNYNPLVPRSQLKKVDPYYKDNDILKSLEFSNKVQITKETVYRNYEEGPYFRAPTPGAITGATAAGTLGGGFTMTLTPGSFSTRKISASLNTSTLFTSLAKNDIFRTYNGLFGFIANKVTTGAVSAVNTVFSVARADTNGADLATAVQYHVTNAIPLSVVTNAFSEGSLQPLEGLSRENVFHVNQTAIIKTHRAITNTANASTMITVRGEERPAATQMVEMGQEHRVKEAMMLWWGTGETFQDATENISTVKVTKGVDGSIREMGNVYQFAQATGFQEADFDAVFAQFEYVRGGNEVQIYAGSRFYAQMQAIIKIKIGGLPAGVFTFQSFGQSDGAKKAIEIGFNTFIINGVTIHLIRADLFNIQGMTDILGYNYPYMAYIIPGEMQTVAGDFIQNGQAVTKMMVPSMVAYYTSQDDNELRRYKYWQRNVEITNRDEKQQELLTEVGGKFSMLRKFFICEGV